MTFLETVNGSAFELLHFYFPKNISFYISGSQNINLSLSWKVLCEDRIVLWKIQSRHYQTSRKILFGLSSNIQIFIMLQILLFFSISGLCYASMQIKYLHEELSLESCINPVSVHCSMCLCVPILENIILMVLFLW